MTDASIFRLAHLSDPHLAPPARPSLREAAGKRGLAYINWSRRRRFRHDMTVLASLVADLRDQDPDHIAITGDLVNLGLSAEFDSAVRFLDGIGEAGKVSLVPGNHDAYVRATAGDAARAWADYMRGDDGQSGFPYVRRRPPIAIVGVSSAVPTALLSAAGRVGHAQAAALGGALRMLEAEALFRVVLIHHPPSRGTGFLRRLADTALVRRTIAGAGGAELVLSGHLHHASRSGIPGSARNSPVISVPSASMRPNGRESAAAYNLYEIGGGPGAWRCRVVVRGLDELGAIAERGQFTLY